MIKVNLLPPEKKAKTKRRKINIPGPSNFMLAFGVITGIAVAISAAGYFYMHQSVSALKTTKQTNEKLITELEQKIAEVKKFDELNKRAQDTSNLIQSLRKMQAVPIKLLNTVSAIMPEGVWLTGITSKDGSVKLQGIAFTNIDVVSYVDNLKASPELQEVFLEESKQGVYEKTDIYAFTINFRVKS
jgi:type IV pilus assembly protein PilN